MQGIGQNLGAIDYTLWHLTNVFHDNPRVKCGMDNKIEVEGKGFVKFYIENPKSMCAPRTLNVAAGPYDTLIAPNLPFAVTEAWDNRRAKKNKDVIVFTMMTEDDHAWNTLEQVTKLCQTLVECLLEDALQ
jgi:hypothetical protein